MNVWHPAHHAKVEGPSSLDQINERLLEEWRERRFVNFQAVDPLPIDQRVLADARLAARRLKAKAWLSPAMISRRRRDRLRANLRVIVGGRQ